MEYQDTD